MRRRTCRGAVWSDKLVGGSLAKLRYVYIDLIAQLGPSSSCLFGSSCDCRRVPYVPLRDENKIYHLPDWS